MSNSVPVILVTGFLGSGKTTLINKILTSTDKKLALILNEFGDIKLESQFIEKEGIPSAELANGCMCCVANSDIPRVIKLVLQQQKQTEAILIEASGLSDPDPIHEVIQSNELNNQVYLSQVICIVDCVNFESTRQEHQIIMSQIADSDTLLLSKINQAGPEKVQAVENLLSQLTMNTTIIHWDNQFDPNSLLQIPHQPPQPQDHHHHDHHDHKHEHYTEIWFTSNTANFTQEQINHIFSQLPAEVVRAKGYANIDQQKHLVQYTSGNLELTQDTDKDWQHNTAILLLGKNLNQELILNSFQLN